MLIDAFIPWLVAAATLGTGPQEDPISSGPRPGAMLGPFRVRMVSGPERGETVELPGSAGEGPLAMVFVRRITRPAARLLRTLDAYAAEHDLDARIIWLADDMAAAEAFLERAEGLLDLRAPVGIFPGAGGPSDYGLSGQAALTVLVAEDRVVLDSLAFARPVEADALASLAALAASIDRDAPSMEVIREQYDARPDLARDATRMDDRPRLEVEVIEPEPVPEDLDPSPIDEAEDVDPVPVPGGDAERLAALERQVDLLTEALNRARAEIARLQDRPPPSPLPMLGRLPTSIPGPGTPPAELQTLMRRLIRRDANDTDVGRLADAITSWVGEDAARRQQLRRFSRRVLGTDLGTEAARRRLRSFLEEGEGGDDRGGGERP